MAVQAPSSIPGIHRIRGGAGPGPKEVRRAEAPGRSRGEAEGDTMQLSDEAQKQVAKLKQRDREVRAHEAAHMAAGGGLVGGASYSFQRGPDGQNYAVGGEVSIDTAPVDGDPEATIQKAEQIKVAALAPASPSAQDRAVAAAASAMAAAAMAELAKQKAQEGGLDVLA